MKSHKHSGAPIRGFSLIELTAAIALSLGVAGASLAIISQHTFFMDQIKSFGFIREEAPQINRILTSLLSSANEYSIYSDKDTAFSNGPKSNTGSAIVLSWRSPSGHIDWTALAFETVAGRKMLNLYTYKIGWSDEPNWTITSMAENISFSDQTGLLTIAMTGSRGEQITYMGGTR